MNRPLVSIIVPCFNQAEYLPETLNSVLAQTYFNWECIIVNDGSPDDTEDVAKKYMAIDERFKYVYQQNKGLAGARNTGVLHSNGEYVLPLDSDDLIGNTYLEEAVGYFISHDNVKLVYCKARKFGCVNESWELPPYSYDTLLYSNCIFCSCIYRRQDFNKTTGYNVNMKYGYEDWDFLLSFLKPQDEVYQIDKELFYYRIKAQSMLTNLSNKMYDTLVQIVVNHPELYSKRYNEVLYLYKTNKYLESVILNMKQSIYYKVGLFACLPIRIWNYFKKYLKRFSLSSKVFICKNTHI